MSIVSDATRLLRAAVFFTTSIASALPDFDARPAAATPHSPCVFGCRADVFIALIALFALLGNTPGSVVQAQTIDHSTGFASHGDLTANGDMAFNGTAAVLSNTFDQTSTMFSSTPVDVSHFSTSFTFSLTNFGGNANNTPGGDGIMFIIQNNAPTSIGEFGGYLAYAGINNSVGVKFDIYQNPGTGDPSDNCTGLFTDGADPFGGTDLTPTGVNLRSGNPLRADISYDGTTLTVKITDTVTNASATQTYPIDIPTTVNSTQAYVGFGGGTATNDATQQILTWMFAAGSSQSSAPVLTSLSPSSATAGSPAFTLTATGTGFASGAVVDWNGSPLTTAFVSATQLMASVPASDVAATGTASVTVNSGTASNPLTFTIAAAGKPTWAAVAAAAGPNGTGRILWDRSDGIAGLWALGGSDVQSAVGPTYGPYAGWMAKSLATAPDGTSRVLWTNTNGAAGVWTFNASGVETKIGPTYGPYSGWTAEAISAAGDGTSRVLWTNTNGEAGVWSLGANDVNTLIGPTYGPISGWTAKSLATASNGASWLLWDRADGAAGVWSLGPDDALYIYGSVYGPFTGWTAKSIGAAGDGTTRVLWANASGAAGVWTFNASDLETVTGPTYGPYSGWSASALATASDGTSRVLWTNASRAAGVWSLGANDVESVVGTTYGPY